MEGILNMWTVAKMRADYEGWWLFSDWPEKVIETLNFNTYEEMLEKYTKLLQDCKDCFDNYVVGKHNIYAFYNNCDLNFAKIAMKIYKYFIVLLF